MNDRRLSESFSKQQQLQLGDQNARCCSHLHLVSLDFREWTPSRPARNSFRQNVETVTAPCFSV